MAQKHFLFQQLPRRGFDSNPRGQTLFLLAPAPSEGCPQSSLGRHCCFSLETSENSLFDHSTIGLTARLRKERDGHEVHSTKHSARVMGCSCKLTDSK